MNPSQIQAPASPLGNFPELAGMYQSTFQLPLSNANVNAQSFQDKTTLANQAAAQQAAQEQQKALADPNNYRVIPRNDGGYGFYDPTGKEISAADYAAVTGKTPQEVLKNSQNPIDIGFHKDFKDLQDYLNNKLQETTNAGAKAKAQDVENQIKNNPALTKMNNGQPIDISSMSTDQLIQRFMHAYPTVYGLTKTGVPDSQVFIPQSRI